MFEIYEALEELASHLEGLRAAMVLETSGIELANWGEADFEVVTAEVAELWRGLNASEALCPGPADSVEVRSPEGAWIVLPIGGEYLLAALAGPAVPPGKVRFYAREWARRNGGSFS